MVSLERSTGSTCFMLPLLFPVASCLDSLYFQISSKLKRMTPLKANAVTKASKTFFLPVVTSKHCTYAPDHLYLSLFRSSVTQAHDISNPNYMGVLFQKGHIVDKGWSYSMPPKNVPIASQGSKEFKKGGHDVGTRSPTGKVLNSA